MLPDDTGNPKKLLHVSTLVVTVTVTPVGQRRHKDLPSVGVIPLLRMLIDKEITEVSLEIADLYTAVVISHVVQTQFIISLLKLEYLIVLREREEVTDTRKAVRVK